MSNQRIRELLTELRGELADTDVDTETVAALGRLEDDIARRLSLESDASGDSLPSIDSSGEGVAIPIVDDDAPEPDQADLLERAKELEVQFATRHPLAERTMQEVVAMLGRMGI